MGKASRKKRSRKPGEVPINAELQAALDQQFKLFKARFGRDPGPNEAIFLIQTPILLNQSIQISWKQKSRVQ